MATQDKSITFNIRERFAQGVRQAMERLDWSETRLAEEAGLSQSAVNRYLKSKSEIGLEALYAILRALGVAFDELLGLTPSEHRYSKIALPSDVRAQIVEAARIAAESALSGYLHSDENRRKIDETLDRISPELYFDIYEFVWKVEQAAMVEAEKERKRKASKP